MRLAALALLLAAPAAGAQQWRPVVALEGRTPAVCGIEVRAGAVSVRLEKRRQTAGIVTVLRVHTPDGAPLRAALRTASADTGSLLAPAAGAGSAFEAAALLEDRLEGGLLPRELAISGGTLEWTAADGGTHRVVLRGPAPRDVAAAYLNCAGDLVAP